MEPQGLRHNDSSTRMPARDVLAGLCVAVVEYTRQSASDAHHHACTSVNVLHAQCDQLDTHHHDAGIQARYAVDSAGVSVCGNKVVNCAWSHTGVDIMNMIIMGMRDWSALF